MNDLTLIVRSVEQQALFLKNEAESRDYDLRPSDLKTLYAAIGVLLKIKSDAKERQLRRRFGDNYDATRHDARRRECAPANTRHL